MSDIKNEYGTADQAITITLASLGSTSLRESTAVDNGTNNFIDALVGGIVTTGTTPTGTKINVYAYGAVGDATQYSGSATGSDAAYGSGTGQIKENLFLVGVITVDATGEAYEVGPFSVASAFEGVLPVKWGVVFENLTGVTFSASGHDITYQGIFATVA